MSNKTAINFQRKYNSGAIKHRYRGWKAESENVGVKRR